VVYPHLLLLANQLLLVTAVVMGFLVMLAGFKAYRQGQTGIRFFLLGWIVLWLGACVATSRAFGWIPTTGWTSYSLQITTAIEMLLVALALGELLHEEHQAHLRSQAQALRANMALLELSQASEEKLNLVVAERTAQLEISLQEEKNLREQYVRIGSMISHEFRTPLSIIQSQATLMRKECAKGIDEVNKRLDAITRASERLKRMFDKWLYSDSLHETLASMELRLLDLQVWVNQQLQEQQQLLTNHTLVCLPGVPVWPVMADKYHLELVLGNLIENAAKYAPAQTTISLELRQKEGFSGVAVTDQGPGIPVDVQDKIFNAFFRASPEGQVRGVGLGLSIVQRIVQAHGGHIELNSRPGQGATFCVWLPWAA
jgi:signal transduction histidine kinase